eukprot:CAMPEP_0180753276 /NCGR_PEP_ID=MMETSP1038_2-20121128/32584_1 /TAXON_ID=632150 /ORGANISM="Azadinium spinosum, Strain 3D9" /LENGTH=143 /DNA_ID=CAMNT_0022787127 /DNA_START=42 /DNA_END=474 /DNA_ORIENTATION=-
MSKGRASARCSNKSSGHTSPSAFPPRRSSSGAPLLDPARGHALGVGPLPAPLRAGHRAALRGSAGEMADTGGIGRHRTQHCAHGRLHILHPTEGKLVAPIVKDVVPQRRLALERPLQVAAPIGTAREALRQWPLLRRPLQGAP